MTKSDSFYRKRLAQQKGVCFYCGIALIRGYVGIGNIEIDHIIPFSISRDGSNKNLCLSCKNCNRIKSDLDIDLFRNKCRDKFTHILVGDKFYFEINKIKF